VATGEAARRSRVALKTSFVRDDEGAIRADTGLVKNIKEATKGLNGLGIAEYAAVKGIKV